MRHGVARIPVSFSVTAKWLKKLAGYAKKDKISVQYFDVETAELKLAEMYVTGYKAKLKKDTSYKGLWTVSFTLKEMYGDGIMGASNRNLLRRIWMKLFLCSQFSSVGSLIKEEIDNKKVAFIPTPSAS